MRAQLIAATWLILTAGTLASAARPLPPGDWPQFRGPNCSGLSAESQPLPAKFSSTENVKWSAKLDDGIGSPAVAAGRVFTSAIINPPKAAEDPFATSSSSPGPADPDA